MKFSLWRWIIFYIIIIFPRQSERGRSACVRVDGEIATRSGALRVSDLGAGGGGERERERGVVDWPQRVWRGTVAAAGTAYDVNDEVTGPRNDVTENTCKRRGNAYISCTVADPLLFSRNPQRMRASGGGGGGGGCDVPFSAPSVNLFVAERDKQRSGAEKKKKKDILNFDRKRIMKLYAWF